MKKKRLAPPTIVVGIDTGGTFTDVVYRVDSREGTFKLPSTPGDPGKAVLNALTKLFADHEPDRLAYGTTVATNAMLERRGAKTALITTHGFEDVIEIGRQARPELYALEPRPTAPLVTRRWRYGVQERTLFDGSIESDLESDLIEDDVRELAAELRDRGVEAVAICFLHAHTNAKNERQAEVLLRKELGRNFPITTSHRISPEPGEYERTNTAVANAYVRPLVENHLTSLAEKSRAKTFRVMQSSGGLVAWRTAAREPVRTMLSGPAGGVVAAAAVARRAGIERMITFDMGGTSTDVAFVDKTEPRRSTTAIAGVPVRVPCIDIHTVGAGGGSIASIDEGGALKVGPESAGAVPGPACYGRGTLPTVSDANVVLGRLQPEFFLGGHMPLDRSRAEEAMESIVRAGGLASARAAAEGIIRVVEGTMERAIRKITVERGRDPRDAVLVAFGGAAGLHACGLAEQLGIERVLVPQDPGLLSAWGILDGSIIRERKLALRLVNPSFTELKSRENSLMKTTRTDLKGDGCAPDKAVTQTTISARYFGQALELDIPLVAGFRRRFDEAHEQMLHTSNSALPLEVVAITVRAAVREIPVRKRKPRSASAQAPSVSAAGRARHGRGLTLVDRDAVRSKPRLAGPAVITEYSSTTFLPKGWAVCPDADDNLLLSKT